MANLAERLRRHRVILKSGDYSGGDLMRAWMDCAVAADEIERLRAALEFYANPEIYKPHPHGPAFDRRDLSLHAKEALNDDA